jgi:4-hydroxybenzoate polyprenyltransferase
MTFLRALRLPNLGIVVLTLLGARAILYGAYGKYSDPTYFWLLTLATLLVLVTGNLINDYFDQKIDAINKPERVLVGRLISEKLTLGIYAALNLAAIALAIFTFLELPHATWILMLYPFWILSLFLYSYQLKCTPVIGNLVVALLCALVPMQAFWLLHTEHHLVPAEMPLRLQAYIAFAFLLTLWREMVKDLEDQKGDALAGCRTLPIAMSENTARYTAIALGFVIFSLLCGMIYSLIPAKYQVFMLAFLLAPCGAAIRWLFESGHPIFYKRASIFIKILMLVGLIVLVYEG